jgi:excinuclease ABC subunit C
VIDGGKGQLSSAVVALEELGLGKQAIVSLAKRDEELFLPGRTDGIRLPRRSPALRMLQQARDEAHRFAITFQRTKRAARTITSELLQIPGVGPSRRRALLHRFGSVQGVRDASLADLAELPGFGMAIARKVHLALGVPVPDTPEPSASESAPAAPSPPDLPLPSDP